MLFLEGKQEALLDRLSREMSEAAERMNFEAAARLRDRIIQVRRVTENQKVVWRSRLDMDLIAAARDQGQACVQVFIVRGGKLIAQENFILDGVSDVSEAEMFREFLTQFYTARAALNTPAVEASPLAVRSARDNEVPVPQKQRARRRSSTAALPKEILIETLPERPSAA